MALKNTQDVVKAISAKIFKYEDAAITKTLEELITANNIARMTSHQGFILQGKYHVLLNAKLGAAQRAGLPNLHFTVLEQGQKYLADFNGLNRDKTLVDQTLQRLIYPCSSNQDLRDALPEVVVEMFPELICLPRTREEAFTLLSNVHAMKQFRAILDKIIAMSMAKYFY